MDTAKAFWLYKLQDRDGDVSMTWAETALGERALQAGETIYEYAISGTLKEGAKIEELQRLVEDQGLRLFRRKYPSRSRPDDECMYVNEDTAVWLDFSATNRSLRTSLTTTNDAKATVLKKLLRSYCEKIVKRGKVFVLVAQNGEIVLKEFGVAGEDFIESNYHPEVVEKFGHVVKDLNSSDPCGRIVILDGPPGSGKTHAVRALLNEVPNATFILVQAGMVSELGSPSFISVLMHQQTKDNPMVLVLEDADECLSSRKADNISAISALLNFSDGIFGAMLDMRIIATTNIKLNDLDKAVMRPGRLCRRIEVGLLDAAQAREVHFRLKGDDGPYIDGHFYSLGEIYTLAKGGESASSIIEEKSGKKAPIGFQTQVREPRVVVRSQGRAVVVYEKDMTEVEDDEELIDEDPDDGIDDHEFHKEPEQDPEDSK